MRMVIHGKRLAVTEKIPLGIDLDADRAFWHRDEMNSSVPCLSSNSISVLLNKIPLRLCLLLFLVGASIVPAAAQNTAETQVPGPGDFLKVAQAAYERKSYQEGMMLIEKAIEMYPKESNLYFARAQFYEVFHKHENAVADLTKVIEFQPTLDRAYQFRGSENFKLGKIKDAITDFDKVIELLPGQAPYHWQRGIALYYDGRYEEGRKQFESHRSVNPSDVENSVWHFLCIARKDGVERARSAFIPVKGDPRIPMMQIQALFLGKGSEEEVIEAAKHGNADSKEMRLRMFYAYLYLALFAEANGNVERTREHLSKAVGEYAVENYMGDVARVHARLLASARKDKK